MQHWRLKALGSLALIIVMIDSDNRPKVFNITLADVPERKNDLVEGKYVVGTKKGATVAVKVTDMLGEEVLVVKEV